MLRQPTTKNESLTTRQPRKENESGRFRQPPAANESYSVRHPHNATSARNRLNEITKDVGLEFMGFP